MNEIPEWDTESYWEVVWRDGTSLSAPPFHERFEEGDLSGALAEWRRHEGNPWHSAIAVRFVTELTPKGGQAA